MSYLNCAITNASLHLRDVVVLFSHSQNNSNFKFFGFPVFAKFDETLGLTDYDLDFVDLNYNVLLNFTNVFQKEDIKDFLLYPEGKSAFNKNHGIQAIYVLKEAYDSMIDFKNENDSSPDTLKNDIEKRLKVSLDLIKTTTEAIQLFNINKFDTECFKETSSETLALSIEQRQEMIDASYERLLELCDTYNIFVSIDCSFGLFLDIKELISSKIYGTRESINFFLDMTAFHYAFYNLSYDIKKEYVFSQGRSLEFHMKHFKKLYESLEKVSLD